MPKIELPKIEVPTIDLKTVDLPDIPPAAARPIYAGVGATDLAVAKVRTYVADAQTKVVAVVAEVQRDVTTKVVGAQSAVKDFQLPKPATLPTRFQASVKANYDKNVTTASATYAELAKRGEVVLTRIRKGEGPAGTVAKNQAPASRDAASAVKATPVAGASAQKAAARSNARKAATKKTTASSGNAAKKAPAKKSTTRTTAAKKTSAS